MAANRAPCFVIVAAVFAHNISTAISSQVLRGGGEKRSKKSALVLHGLTMTANEMATSYMVGFPFLADALSNDWDFVYAEAPYNATMDFGVPYGVRTGKSWFEDYTLPYTATDEASQSIAVLREIIQAQGPFDAVLGFSQGSAFIPYLLSQVPVGTFDKALMFGGFSLFFYTELEAQVQAAKAGFPSALYYAGMQDTIVNYTYTVFQSYYSQGQNPTLVLNPTGIHTLPFPSDTDYFNQVIAFLSTPSATGDPHLQNVHGERFDLMKTGSHVLLNIPRGERAENALLHVQAQATRLGGQCAEIYFTDVNITGSWALSKRAGGYHVSSESDVHEAGTMDLDKAESDVGSWISLGPVGLKIVRASTASGTRYLNFYVKHLSRAGFAVGGLLGEDDHEEVSAPPAACMRSMALDHSHAHGRGSSAVSSAQATFW